MPNNEIVTFDGKYGRQGYITVAIANCLRCHEENRLCLIGDASEGEYAILTICGNCVTQMIDRNTDL